MALIRDGAFFILDFGIFTENQTLHYLRPINHFGFWNYTLILDKVWNNSKYVNKFVVWQKSAYMTQQPTENVNLPEQDFLREDATWVTFTLSLRRKSFTECDTVGERSAVWSTTRVLFIMTQRIPCEVHLKFVRVWVVLFYVIVDFPSHFFDFDFCFRVFILVNHSDQKWQKVSRLPLLLVLCNKKTERLHFFCNGRQMNLLGGGSPRSCHQKSCGCDVKQNSELRFLLMSLFKSFELDVSLLVNVVETKEHRF